MDENILKALYRGALHMEETLTPRTPAYRRQQQKVLELEAALRAALPPELRDDLDRLSQARLLLTGIEVEEACLTGMKTGAQLLSALLDEDSPADFRADSTIEP